MAKAQQNRKFIIVGIVAYIVFVLMMFPVNRIYQLLPNMPLPVEVVALNGTLWDAQAVVKHPMVGQVNINWQLSPMSLFVGQMKAAWQLKSPSVNAKGQMSMALGGDLQIQDTKAFIQPQIINQILRPQKASMSGDVELNVQNLLFNLNTKQTQQAQGRLIWSGGDVSYLNRGKTKTASLPIIVASLSSQDGQLLADVNTSEGLLIAQGSLKPDGWASLAILKRLVDLIGETWPNNTAADTRILEVSEKIF